MNNQYRRGNGYEDYAGNENRRIPQNGDPSVQLPAPYYPQGNNNQARHRQSGDNENRYRPADEEAPKEATFKNRVSHPVPPLRLILDAVLIGLGIVPIVILNYVAKPFQRGFYCNDESIRYPLKENTISSLLLYVVGAAIVAVVVIIVETATVLTGRKNYQLSYSIHGKPVPALISSLYIYLGYCFVGYLLTQIPTDICKMMVGRLRPHFVAACDPDWTKINCTEHNYVRVAFCQNTNQGQLQEARVSFLSGHASFAAYMMVYLALYLQARWRWPGCSLMAKHVLQLAFIVLALYTGLTRINDYKHHWSDVIAGFALGIVSAYITVFFIGHFFRREAQARLESEITTGFVSPKACSVIGGRYVEQAKELY